MKSSAWLIIVTILRPYDGYTWNTHQFLDSAFMHEEKITLEILGISHDIFSRSQAVFFDSEVPVTVAAEEILQPMVCVGVEDFAEKPVATVLGRVSRGGDDAGEESNWTADKHTAMGFQRGLPVAGSGLRVPQDSQVARRGRGIHHQVQRFTVAEPAAAVCKRP